jgi:hypothetical protein
MKKNRTQNRTGSANSVENTFGSEIGSLFAESVPHPCPCPCPCPRPRARSCTVLSAAQPHLRPRWPPCMNCMHRMLVLPATVAPPAPPARRVFPAPPALIRRILCTCSMRRYVCQSLSEGDEFTLAFFKSRVRQNGVNKSWLRRMHKMGQDVNA